MVRIRTYAHPVYLYNQLPETELTPWSPPSRWEGTRAPAFGLVIHCREPDEFGGNPMKVWLPS